jgi:hypothetical protein
MIRRLSALVTTTLACITLAGCVSEGSSYSTYDRTYTRYERPTHVYRDRQPSRDWDRSRHDDRRDRDRRDDRRNHDSRGDRDRGENSRADWRERDGRPQRPDGRPDRDGGRIWVPNQ